jgi:hypothetical protein
LWGYCISFKTNRLPILAVRSWRYNSDWLHQVQFTLHISQALLLWRDIQGLWYLR